MIIHAMQTQTSSCFSSPPPSFFARGCKVAGFRNRRRRATTTSAKTNAKTTTSTSTINERKGQPIKPGQSYPAKEHCSNCGLCDTTLVSYVKDACAFLGPGMSRIEKLEEKVHGKARNAETDELRLGVLYTSDTKDNTNNSSQSVFYAKKKQPVEKAQWTGIVTSVALEMLRTKTVDCVVAVGSGEADARNPEP